MTRPLTPRPTLGTSRPTRRRAPTGPQTPSKVPGAAKTGHFRTWARAHHVRQDARPANGCKPPPHHRPNAARTGQLRSPIRTSTFALRTSAGPCPSVQSVFIRVPAIRQEAPDTGQKRPEPAKTGHAAGLGAFRKSSAFLGSSPVPPARPQCPAFRETHFRAGRGSADAAGWVPPKPAKTPSGPVWAGGAARHPLPGRPKPAKTGHFRPASRLPARPAGTPGQRGDFQSLARVPRHTGQNGPLPATRTGASRLECFAPGPLRFAGIPAKTGQRRPLCLSVSIRSIRVHPCPGHPAKKHPTAAKSGQNRPKDGHARSSFILPPSSLRIGRAAQRF
jgi:hypothetical protein